MRNRDIKRRLTGLSLPVVGGGASWQVVESSQGVARRVLIVLADRRVLFNPYWQEQAAECVASVIEVRRMLTAELGSLHDDQLSSHLEAMRASCRQFLDRVVTHTESDRRQELWRPHGEVREGEVELVRALGELRSLMGVQVGLVASIFRLDVPETLVSILPPPPDDGAEIDLHIDPGW